MKKRKKNQHKLKLNLHRCPRPSCSVFLRPLRTRTAYAWQPLDAPEDDLDRWRPPLDRRASCLYPNQSHRTDCTASK